MSGTHNTSHGPIHGTLVQIGTLHGAVDIDQSERRAVRILPKGPSRFQNRDAELARLDAFLAQSRQKDGRRLCCVVGPPGVGKTATVVTWINQNREHFGHAQIALPCGGDPGEGAGRGIEEVCDQYFRQMGVDTDAPGFDTLEGRLHRFRQHTEGRPVVVLLDDVRSAAQVEPFLPDLPGMVVITTSRTPIRGLGLHAPLSLPIGPLADEAVAALLRDIVEGEDRFADEAAFARLVALCGGIPLIAGHAASLLYDDRGLTVAELVARMEESGRLTLLEESVASVQRPAAVFDVFYDELPQDAAYLYRALGSHPTRDFDRWSVGALFPGAPQEAGAALDLLARRSLVKQAPGGRRIMEDLTYEHAGLVARGRGTAQERARVRDLICDYYLYGAVAADTAGRWKLGPLYGEPAPVPLPDFAAANKAHRESTATPGDLEPWLEHRRRVRDRSALPVPGDTSHEWFESSLDAIIACMRRSGRLWEGDRPRPGYRWQLAEATNAFFAAYGHRDARATVLALGTEDAEACEDQDAMARMHAQWGEALLGQGRLDEAEEHLRRSLAAASHRDAKVVWGRGAALEWLGILERRRGRPDAADVFLDASLPFLDRSRARPVALHHMHKGDVALLRDDGAAALEEYRRSAEWFRRHADEKGPDFANEGKVLANQARLLAAGRPDQAVALLESALDRFVKADRAHQAGKVLELLGDLGADTRKHWGYALEVFGLIGDTAAVDRVSGKLAELPQMY
ncbi:hypothetical protein [Nocardiopsis sp. CC223A]|uniref:hypothetical protein n=1 Tax=Nocardiopsis sp. CC223A TaxID=3044051 RepID=UPI00278C7B7E|nr:hypothetical protein [Nocardiopsis sp. CC223A]